MYKEHIWLAPTLVFIYKFHRILYSAGQLLNSSQAEAIENLPDDSPWHVKLFIKKTRVIAVLVPVLVYQLLWWALAIRGNLWHLFQTKWPMCVVMTFGSIIAGTLITFCVKF